jgi:hypothetical protein
MVRIKRKSGRIKRKSGPKKSKEERERIEKRKKLK